jgi:hypothetical protein
MPTNEHRKCASIARSIRTPRPLLTPLMLAALGIAGIARADEPSAPPVGELIKRIEALEASNKALSGEVETLRASNGASWLSEERAAEIRALVSDVLADSASRDSLQSAGMTAGWNDGFFLASPDGRFLMQASGLVQTRFIYGYVPDGDAGTGSGAPASVSDTRESLSGFDLPGTLLDLKGHVFGEEFGYKLRGEFTNVADTALGQNPVENLGPQGSSFRLLDAYVRFQLADDFSVRVGQFKLPFAREFLVDRAHQLAVSRSTIVEHLGIGRSQGIEAAWAWDDFRVMATFSNGGQDNVYGPLKVAGTEPVGSPWFGDASDYAVTARGEWKFAGEWRQFESMTSPPGDNFGLMWGLAGHYQEGDPDLGGTTPTNPPNEWVVVTTDVSAMFGGATLFASLTYSYADSGQAYIVGPFAFSPTNIGVSSSWGAVVQGSIYLVPKWELFARYEWGDADITNIGDIPAAAGLSNGNALNLATIGVNWYIDGEDLKWSADMGFALDSVDGVWNNTNNGWRPAAETGEFVFRTQLQLAF